MLNNLNITQAREKIANGDISVEDLVKDVFTSIDKHNEDLNVYLAVNENALVKAKRLDQELLKNPTVLDTKPLYGIPIAVKDNFLTINIPTTASARVLDGYMPQYESTVVNKLKGAGAIIIGKTNMDAWAHGSSTETSDYGPTKNPWDITKLPGGSSGGSAAAVAADMCLAAIGSETAGSIRQLDSSITAKRKLHIACYGIGAVKGITFKTQCDLFKWLRTSRFPTPQGAKLAKGTKEVNKAINEIQSLRNELPFEVDGAVIKVNDFSLQKQLGVKTREPHWATAFKFPAKRKTTKLINIEASVGRQGAITPVANLEPVEIAGATVSNASLHNWDEIQRKDIRIGDTVEVERAGDVIPHVIAIITEKRNGSETPYYYSQRCPACGSLIIREEDEVAFKCININCNAQAIEKIKNFASKAAMDIEGLGEKNVELLYSSGLINHFVDLYTLKKEDILKLPRFAKKSAQNLINAIENSKTTTLYKFIYSLGIKDVGEYAARLLAKHYETINDLCKATERELKKIEQVGDKVASSISSFFSNQDNIEAINSIINLGLKLQNPDFTLPAKERTSELLSDRISFVVTGTFPEDRKIVKNYIESLGGRNVGSISKSTDYLVVGENPGPSKLNKAKKLGIKTISYNELMKLTKDELNTK